MLRERQFRCGCLDQKFVQFEIVSLPCRSKDDEGTYSLIYERDIDDLRLLGFEDALCWLHDVIVGCVRLHLVRQVPRRHVSQLQTAFVLLVNVEGEGNIHCRVEDDQIPTKVAG